MQQVCRAETIRLQDVLRNQLKDKLSDLFWDNPYAYSQLCIYCETMKIEREAKKILTEKGILDAKGDLPTITREAIYELTTGLAIS